MAQEPIPLQQVQNAILFIRGQKVLLDRDLASLYGVETRTLNQAVQRNLDRFPEDFMFQLTADEASDLRSQFVISSQGTDKKTARSTHGGRRSLPFVFTEQGVAMLSSVLRSPRAVQVNISIMRAFVQLRELMSTHKDLARKLAQLEKKYDENFRVVFEAIRQLMTPPTGKPKGRIGF